MNVVDCSVYTYMYVCRMDWVILALVPPSHSFTHTLHAEKHVFDVFSVNASSVDAPLSCFILKSFCLVRIDFS